MEWQSRTIPSGVWRSIAYGADKFVAVGYDSSTIAGICCTSTDGIAWTNRSISVNRRESIAYGNGRFVAVGATSAYITSTDGINWTTRTLPTITAASEVIYENGLFVIVGSYPNSSGSMFSNYCILTSADGISWSVTELGFSYATELAFGNNIFLAIQSATMDNLEPIGTLTSPNGVNWTTHANVLRGYTYGLAYGNGLFVNSRRDSVVYSSDGITWTPTTGISGGQYGDITFENNQFVAVGSSKCASSSDGINWTAETIPAGGYGAVAFGDKKFVAVGNGVCATSDAIAPGPKIYVGVNGVARKVKSIYVGVNGTARKATKGYIGIDGVARLL